ncbi:MAG: hypothetical protein ACM3WU_04280 [Bacillota bacterium]
MGDEFVLNVAEVKVLKKLYDWLSEERIKNILSEEEAALLNRMSLFLKGLRSPLAECKPYCLEGEDRNRMSTFDIRSAVHRLGLDWRAWYTAEVGHLAEWTGYAVIEKTWPSKAYLVVVVQDSQDLLQHNEEPLPKHTRMFETRDETDRYLQLLREWASAKR